MDEWYADLEGGADLPPLTPQEQQQLEAMAENPERRRREAHPLAKWYEDWLAWEKEGATKACLTGLGAIDEGLGKLIRPTEVILLAARTGVGKSWGVQTFIETNLEKPEHVGLISALEMSGEQTAERFAVHALKMTPKEVADRAAAGMLTVAELVDATKGAERILVCDQPLTPDEVGDLVVQCRADGHDVSIVCVDYFGLLSYRGSGGRYDRASAAALAMKEIAKEHRVVVVLAAQLNRDAKTGDSEPQLSHLRDSGVIEEAADRIVLLWRDEETGTDVQAKLAKNRHGRMGARATLHYDSSMRLVPGTGVVRAPESVAVDDEFEGIFGPDPRRVP